MGSFGKSHQNQEQWFAVPSRMFQGGGLLRWPWDYSYNTQKMRRREACKLYKPYNGPQLMLCDVLKPGVAPHTCPVLRGVVFVDASDSFSGSPLFSVFNPRTRIFEALDN